MTIMHTRNNRRLGFTMIELMIVIAVIAILASILTPSFLKARAQSQLTACKSNVKNIGTACEMFAIDRKGRYPEQLAFLTLGAHGGYLKSIPSCPAAGYDTYSNSYTFASNPDCFTVRCGGANHIALNIPEGYPLYDSVVGLACTGEPGGSVASAGGSGNGGSESGGSGSGSGSAASDSGSGSAGDVKKSNDDASVDKGSASAGSSETSTGSSETSTGSSELSAEEQAAAQRTAAINAGTEYLKQLQLSIPPSHFATLKDGKTGNKYNDWQYDWQVYNIERATAIAALARFGLDNAVAGFSKVGTNGFNIRPDQYNPIVLSNFSEDQLYNLGLALGNY